jgi:hypothetical protein
VDSVRDWDPGYLISTRRKEKIFNFHFFEELDVPYMEGLLRFVLENWDRIRIESQIQQIAWIWARIKIT